MNSHCGICDVEQQCGYECSNGGSEMTTQIEAMKLAIEALEIAVGYAYSCEPDVPFHLGEQAITALRAAIEAAEKAEKVSKGLQPLVDSCKETRYRRDIKTAVDRFLCWKLPADFAPDAGISFDKQHKYESYRWPIGTNLFTGPQAKAMFEHCLEGTGYVVNPAPPSAEIEKLRRDAFDKGWIMAAQWAGEVYLLADMDSAAYKKERDIKLQEKQP